MAVSQPCEASRRGEVALVHDVDRHLRVELTHAPHLAVLAGDETLIRRRSSMNTPRSGQVEVRAEAGDGRALRIPVAGGTPPARSASARRRGRAGRRRARSEGWAKRTCPAGAQAGWLVRPACAGSVALTPPRPVRPGRDAGRRLAGAAGACGVQAHDVGVELLDDARQRHDVEDALAAGQQVDDLAVRAGQHRAGPGQHEVGRRQVRAQVLAQALHRPAGRLEGDAGVEQLLDHLELEHVGVRVDASGATPLRRRPATVGAGRYGPSSRAGGT